MKPKPMLTLSQVMAKLAQRDVTQEFCMNEAGEMKLKEKGDIYQPTDLKILRSYRFEADSSPEDNAVLYVAKASDGNIGMIIDSYGAESNYEGPEFDNFIRDIPVEEDETYNFDS